MLLAVIMVVSMLPVYTAAEEAASSEEIPATEETLSTEETTEETEEAAGETEETTGETVQTSPTEEPEETVPQTTEALPEETVPVEETQSAEDSDQAMLSGDTLADGRCGSTVNWELNMSGELTIFGTGRMWNYSSSSPAPWDTYRSSIVSVTVKEGVTYIGSYAFAHCSDLSRVYLPETLTETGEDSFLNCKSLYTISLPYSLVKIGDFTFSNCSNLQSILIPDEVTTIGNGAFEGCTRLSSVNMSGSSVTSIGFRAFRNCVSLRTVTTPKTLLKVGESAFEGSGIGSFDFQDHVTEIGPYAFRDCAYLGTLELPASVQTVGTGAFQNAGIQWVTIESDNAWWGSGVFSDCTSLRQAELPEGMDSIPSGMFRNCPKLFNITLPAGITEIGDGAFQNCTSLESLPLPESLNEIGIEAFSGCTALREVNIPGKVGWINNSAFHQCGMLTSIEIPKSVVYLGKGAFSSCAALETARISGPITVIWHDIFRDCESLKTVTIPGTVETIYDGAFANCTSLKQLAVPCGVTSFSGNPFSGCDSSLTLTVLAGSEAEAFAKEAGIKYVTCTHGSRQSVEAAQASCVEQGCIAHWHCPVCGVLGKDYYFSERLDRAEVFFWGEHVPVHVEAAAASCLEDGNVEHWICNVCNTIWTDEERTQVSSAAAVVIPAAHSLTCIQGYAPTARDDGLTKHWHCSVCDGYWLDSNLTQPVTREELVIPATGIIASGQYGSNIQWAVMTSGTLILSGTGAMADSGDTYPWTAQKNNILSVTVNEGITEIGDGAFQDLTMLVSVSLPDGITDLGLRTFKNCSALTSIVIPQGIAEIQDSTFANCTSLSSVTIPDSVTTILYSAFYNCDALTEITLPDSITELYGYAFEDCAALKRVVLPESLELLDSCVFSGCTALESVVIPPKVTHLGNNAFANCTSLNSVTFPDGFRSIGYGAFKNCTSLTDVRLPDSLTEMESEAFLGCTGLSSIAIPDGVTRIRTYVFQNCDNLTSVKLPANLEAIYTEAFLGCTRLKTLAIPYSVTEIDETAFDQCPNLTLLVVKNSPAHSICSEQNFRYRFSGNRPEDAMLVSFEWNEKMTACSATVTVSPGVWYYYSSISFYDMVLTSNGEQVAVSNDYAKLNTFCLVNTGEEAMTCQLVAAFPLGTIRNPEAMVPGENSICLAEGERKGYYFSWTAEKDSILTITMLSENWSYLVKNKTTGAYDSYLKSDRDPLINPSVWEVPAGHTMEVHVKNYDPANSNHFPAGEIRFLMEYEEVVKPALRLVPGAKAPAELIMLDPAGNVTRKPYRAVDYIVSLNKTDVAENPFSFPVTPESWDEQGNPRTLNPKALKWSTSDSRIATVKDGVVTVIAKTDGACVITLVNTETRDEAYFTIRVRDFTPRLESAGLTLNTQRRSGASIGLLESYGNEICEVSLHDFDAQAKDYSRECSASFRADYENGVLTVTHNTTLKNGTYKLLLKVLCEDGETYAYKLSVKVANKLPSVTVKQLGKLNTFYKDGTARFQIICKDVPVEDVTFRTDSFQSSYDPETGILTVSLTEACRNGEVELAAGGNMEIHLADYRVPVTKSVKISTENKAPKLVLSESASIVNTALSSAPATSFRVYYGETGEAVAAESIRADASFASCQVDENGLVTVTLTGGKGGSVDIYVQDQNWTGAVKLSHKITVQTRLPVLKVDSAKVILNTVFTDQTAKQILHLDQTNAAIGGVTWEAVSRKDAELQEVNKLLVEVSGNAIIFRLDPQNLPRKGSYTIQVTVSLQDGTQLAPKTFKVVVEDKVPTVKLKTAALKLNRILGTNACATTAVTLPKGVNDYRVVDFVYANDDVELTCDAAGSELRVTLVNPNADVAKQTVNLYPVVEHLPTGQQVTLDKPLKLTVQIYEGKPSITVKASGKLDTIAPNSAVTYTIAKMKNIAGEVKQVRLEGNGADLFDIALLDGRAVVTLKDGVVYQKDASYKLNLIYSIAGQEVPVPVTVKVTQSPLKLAPVKPLNLYQANSFLSCTLTVTAPAGAKIDSITLGSKTDGQFRNALGGDDGVTFVERADGTILVSFRIQNAAFLNYGKSYTVYLNILPQGNAENAAPTSVKLTVKTFK